ncbi:MAG: hypothetical protein DRO16_02310 [Thermoprotei archaeon]|nr:MAG: hypothetical protein DRO16_02310 [Thermoprotei archaeon]
MTKCSEVLNQIITWLKQGKPGADKLVDFPWEVEEKDNNTYIAIHPMFPIKIFIGCDEEIGVIRLQTILDVETISLNNDERLVLYHKLLKLNASPLTKFILVGDEDLPAIAVDLSTKTLGKDEFNDALALLLATVNASIKLLGLEEVYSSKLFMELLNLVKKHIEEGWGREKLINYLIKNAKLKKEQAVEIVDSLLKGLERVGTGPYM